ncbi:MAG: SUMF1/EgtB/PvdO family nonheme iron enzyme [Acidimicrobiales bacterium]
MVAARAPALRDAAGDRAADGAERRAAARDDAGAPPGGDRRHRAAPTDDATADLVRHDGGRRHRHRRGWAYDNERPPHVVELAPYALGRDPVTNRQVARLRRGWRLRRRAPVDRRRLGVAARPGSRHRSSGAAPAPWSVERFGRRLDLDAWPTSRCSTCAATRPAFCRWSGTRLPTELEWEAAARWDPATGRARRYPWGDDAPTAAHANLGQRHDGPAAVGSFPAGASPLGVRGLIGDVWEWTASTFTPHPGYVTFPYAEYSEVFFGDEYRVLRGGSWAADPVAVRGAFRNWDYPIRRQIFCGLRVARDA